MKYYKYMLDDYSLPAFISSEKPFFGTKSQYETLKTSKSYNCAEAKLIGENTFELYNLIYEHKNTYGFIYKTKASKYKINKAIFEADNKYYICYKITAHNPSYYNDLTEQYSLLDGFFLGFPKMITMCYENDNIILENTLYVTEKTFNNKEEAFEYFLQLDIDLSPFYKEIFGDG